MLTLAAAEHDRCGWRRTCSPSACGWRCPLLALLLLVDIALALLGRSTRNCNLLSLAFPVKMLAALVVLAWLAVCFRPFSRPRGGVMTACVTR